MRTGVSDIVNEVCETHFEWLLHLAVAADRRIAPFEYGEPVDFYERREWDIRSSLPKG